MMTGSFNNLPRWLLSLEMAVCLGPLTWLFIATVAGTARGVMPPELGVLVGSTALLGPVGITVAAWMAFLSGSSLSRTTATVMALLAAWTVFACGAQMIQSGAFADGWRDFVLMAVLPAWAVAHLLQINAERRAMEALTSSTLV